MSSNTILFKPYKILKSALASTPIREGQCIFCTDTGEIFVDTAENTRVAMGKDASTDEQISNLSITVNNKANNKLTWTTTLDTNWIGVSAPYTKTVSLTNMLSTYIPQMDLIYSNTTATAITEQEEYNKISKIESGNGNITLTCFEEAPTSSLNVRIEVLF